MSVSLLEKKILCFNCIGDSYLSKHVENNGKKRTCRYCKEKNKSLSLGEISELVENAFEKHFSRTANEPNSYEYLMLRDREIDYSWDREGQETVYAIMDAADITEEI